MPVPSAHVTALSCLTALAFAPSTARAQTVALVDCARVTSYADPAPMLPFPSLVDVHADEEPFHALVAWSDEPQALLEIDSFVELVYTNHMTLLDDGDIELRPLDSGLAMLVVGDERAKKIVATANGLVAMLSAPIALDAIVIRGDGNLSPPSVLDAAQAEALFAQHDAGWHGAGSSVHTRPLHLGNHRSVTYDRTAYLEVAEESSIHYAHTSQLIDGAAITVVPHRTSSGEGVLLQVQFALGHLLETAPLEHNLPGVPSLERPVLQSTAGSMSGIVEPGGAIALRIAAPADLGGHVILAVRARPEALPAVAGLDYAAIPVSALGQYGGSSEPMPWNGVLNTTLDSGEWEFAGDEEDMMPLDEDSLQDLIRSSIDPDAWDDTQNLASAGGYLHVFAPQGSRAKVREMVGFFEKQFVKNTEIWVTHGKAGPGIWLPATTSRVHAIRHGVESTGIRKVEVEIAKESSGAIPVVRSTHDGIGFQVRTTHSQGDVFAQLRWIEQRTPRDEASTSLHHLPPQRHRMQAHTGSLPTAGTSTGDSLFGPQTWHAAVR